MVNKVGKMSETQLAECRKQFWISPHQKTQGLLSWGDFTKMLSVIEIRLSRLVMNRLFQASDKHKHGYITFTDFIDKYFEYDMKVEKTVRQAIEPIREISAKKLHEMRKHFFDQSKKRYGQTGRLDFVKMTKEIGISMTTEDYHHLFCIAERSKIGKIPFEELISVFFKSFFGGDRRMAELAIIERYFLNADNKDGKIDKSEFRGLLKSVGIELPPRQLSYLFRVADKDKGGSITFDEFEEIYMSSNLILKSVYDSLTVERIQLSQLPVSSVTRLRCYFSKFDANRDGRVSWEDFLEMVSNSDVYDTIVRNAFNIVRHNRDNSISFREFTNLFSTAEEMFQCFGTSLKSSSPDVYY